MRYTIQDLKRQFPNENVCLSYIWEKRFGDMKQCPMCLEATKFHRVKSKKVYECSCGYQISPLAGTIFAKSKTSLVLWFHALYLMSTTRNGVSAKELERQLGVTYKCAFRIGHQIRKMMANTNENPLIGVIQADETYVGGKITNKHAHQRHTGKSPVANKVMVLGLVNATELRLRVVLGSSDNGQLILPELKKHIAPHSIMVTDSYPAYIRLKINQAHKIVNHGASEYVNREGYHTNTIEGAFAHFKRMVYGTHIQVSKKYMQNYANECAFRYTNRKAPNMFISLLSRI